MLNLNNNYICALDIGSSKIAACVAEVKRKKIGNIFFESAASRGVKQGIIVDSTELVSAVTKVLKSLKTKSGIPIKLVDVNISGQDIVTKHSRAILPLAERGNKVITVSDIEKVHEQARILGSSLEEEIIHRVPSGYTIDSKTNVQNPIGLYSHRLEADLYLVCGKLSSIQSLSRVVHQAGYEIRNLCFSGLATAKAVLGEEFQEGWNIFCDVGSDTTELLFFKDGLLREIEILAMGGDDLTAALQEEFKIPFELAEEIKRSYGLIGDVTQIRDDKEILVKKSNLYKPIKQRKVAEVISAAAKGCCAKINSLVEKKVSCYEVNTFVIVGRTVLLEGLIESLESCLSIPVRLGRILNPDIPAFVKENSELAGHKYLTYLTCVGMLCEELEEDKTIGIPTNQKQVKNILAKTINRFRDVYQEYF